MISLLMPRADVFSFPTACGMFPPVRKASCAQRLIQVETRRVGVAIGNSFRTNSELSSKIILFVASNSNLAGCPFLLFLPDLAQKWIDPDFLSQGGWVVKMKKLNWTLSDFSAFVFLPGPLFSGKFCI